jgi:hypothetical protein
VSAATPVDAILEGFCDLLQFLEALVFLKGMNIVAYGASLGIRMPHAFLGCKPAAKSIFAMSKSLFVLSLTAKPAFMGMLTWRVTPGFDVYGLQPTEPV